MGRIGGALRALCVAVALASAVPVLAESPREMLVTAAFADHDRALALARIERARVGASVLLGRRSDDQEAALIHATALGYRAKLTGSRSDAIAARKQFEGLAARFPRNPETVAALGAWHVGAVVKLGRIGGRMALGAQKGVGLDALDRAVTLGGDRAMFLGLAGLLRLELDAHDPRALQLIQAAVHGATPTAIDRILQRASIQVLAVLHKGDAKAAQKLAQRLLPLGQLAN
ncbi:MAG TPA: hypothetical protein VFQ57_00675 [Sphingomonas sp.]|nr:hypothetical protein [Sphingomonas sp.]